MFSFYYFYMIQAVFCGLQIRNILEDCKVVSGEWWPSASRGIHKQSIITAGNCYKKVPFDEIIIKWSFRNKIFVLEIEFQAESKNEQLQIYYKVCYARVLDYRRKFIEAAQRYNELSYRGIIHEDERMTALRNALICTVLASAGMWMSVL